MSSSVGSLYLLEYVRNELELLVEWLRCVASGYGFDELGEA